MNYLEIYNKYTTPIVSKSFQQILDVDDPQLVKDINIDNLIQKENKDSKFRSINQDDRMLLCSEINFLTREVNKLYNKNKKIFVVYMNYNSNHIRLLAKYFPKLIFELYDYKSDEIYDIDNIVAHNELFDKEEAIHYKDMTNDDIVFLISNSKSYYESIMRDSSTYEINKSITNDLYLQKTIYETLRPKGALLNFVLPVRDQNKSVLYLDGDIYYQPWSTSNFPIARIIPNGLTKYYIPKVFENQMLYFNRVVRRNDYFKFTDSDNRDNHDYNSVYEEKVLKNYVIKMNADNKFIDEYYIEIDKLKGISRREVIYEEKEVKEREPLPSQKKGFVKSKQFKRQKEERKVESIEY